MVVGAGLGPLIRATLQDAEETVRKLKVYAVEKNPNAVVALHSLVKIEGWEKIVMIISCDDMLCWDAPEQADILTEEKQVRKYSPLLDSRLLLENNVSTAEFKTIPDIWRSTAEKFGDRIALVDPHHDAPTNMTYKHVEQDLLDFSEGLRVIGIKPTEKIVLFFVSLAYC